MQAGIEFSSTAGSPFRDWFVSRMCLMKMEMSNFRIQPEEYNKAHSILTSLFESSHALLASIISRSGQEIACCCDHPIIDRTALAALAASNLAATFGIAELIEETEFKRVYHRGKSKSILMVPIGDHFFLLLVFPNSVRSADSLRSVKSAVSLLNDLFTGREETGG